ncbi:hypothetical protein B0A48_08386 [Cryoendolithus antarcticus]|uniref:Uncharacterized protein n=1 Tax=Cryoendolithus antarcticus TaxID=1507870 RepID=A0A1V8T5R4_9PEZI|nr:hypothetical protein B0A48_08386 [Cryoendolithus antarcticus]
MAEKAPMLTPTACALDKFEAPLPEGAGAGATLVGADAGELLAALRDFAAAVAAVLCDADVVASVDCVTDELGELGATVGLTATVVVVMPLATELVGAAGRLITLCVALTALG